MKNKLELILLVKGNRRHEIPKSLYDQKATQLNIDKNGWKLANEKQIEQHYGVNIEKKDEVPRVELKIEQGKKDRPQRLESRTSNENQSSDHTINLEPHI